jgi:hypothetical protein
VARGGTGLQASGNACNFANNNANYFTFTSSPLTGTTGGPWGVALWFYCPNYTNYIFPLSHTSYNTDSAIEIALSGASTNNVYLTDESVNPASWGSVSFTCPGWNFVLIGVDSSHIARMYAGPAGTGLTVTSYGAVSGIAGAATFTKLGVEGNLANGTNGYLDEIPFFSNYNPANATDAANLYNGGAGLAF